VLSFFRMVYAFLGYDDRVSNMDMVSNPFGGFEHDERARIWR